MARTINCKRCELEDKSSRALAVLHWPNLDPVPVCGPCLDQAREFAAENRAILQWEPLPGFIVIRLPRINLMEGDL